MWLPKKLYQRLPLIWIVAGLAFVAAAFYMTFNYKWSIWHFGAGISCLVWGATLYMVRSRRDKEAVPEDTHAKAAD